MALLLDLANIAGGLLLALPLLPRVRVAGRVAPVALVVGVVALVAGGYYLLVHAVNGPHVFHFELVGIGVGVALLWHRLTGRGGPRAEPAGGGTGPAGGGTGPALLLAVFGLIAIVVGIQGLFTPDG
jgi:hypothetical protein